MITILVTGLAVAFGIISLVALGWIITILIEIGKRGRPMLAWAIAWALITFIISLLILGIPNASS